MILVMFRYHLFPNAFMRFVMFLSSAHVSHMFMDIINMQVRIMCNFHSVSMSINVVHAIASIRSIAFAPFPSA